MTADVFLVFLHIFGKLKHSSFVEYYASSLTGFEVSTNSFYSTEIQTVSLFLIVECQKLL